MKHLQMTCHCGAVRQTLPNQPCQLREAPNGFGSLKLCHCFGCRHSTGLLYASYYRLQNASITELVQGRGLTDYVSVGKLKEYEDHKGDHGDSKVKVTLYFCSTCGCHVFRTISQATQDLTVEVASGTLTHGTRDPYGQQCAPDKFGIHVNMQSALDGGISKWMTNEQVFHHENSDSLDHGHYEQSRQNKSSDATTSVGHNFLAASCLCKRFDVRISRPNDTSLDATSYYPDLMIPYHTSDPEINNPRDVKWWLQDNNTKYLAGLCACKSCRLTSGFEIQSWAFIPRTNILFQKGSPGSEADWSILDFDDLHDLGVIRGYESSPGVMREFCPTCGATLFWHGKLRPQLIDVSVGLLEGDGVRVESWLSWWMGRVSFAEDAELGRHQEPASRARLLLNTLEGELKASNEVDTK